MHRQQVRRFLPLAQQPLPILTPPRKHLVGIHAVRPRHLGHRRPRLKRLFDDPPLLRNRAPPARLSLNDYPLRSVHLFPKWTLGPSSPTSHTSHSRPEPDAYSSCDAQPMSLSTDSRAFSGSVLKYAK